MSKIRTVLVVDDDRDTCLALHFMLESWGFLPVVAHDAKQAIDACREHDIGLVLLDHSLGQGTGLDVAAHLAKSAGRPRIVMLSGHAPAVFQPWLDSHCIDAVMHKPVTPSSLQRVLDAMLASEGEAPT